ncbi:MAG: glycosyltransferase family 39 protein [Alphaproteobacteria bacterium]|nr:glycosyltransferase family 39 protein [Alphaproteobacteria bacterium]
MNIRLKKYINTSYASALAHLVLIVFVCLGYVYYIQIQPSPDQQLFDYVGWHLVNGHALYLDVFEINFPIKPAIHMLSIKLFGAEIWSFRTLDYLMNVLIAFAGYAFFRKLGFALAAVVFVPVYLLSYVTAGAWMAGQIDHTAHAFLFLSLISLSLSQRMRECTLLPPLAGALSALSFLTKPTMLTFPVGAALVLLLMGYRANQLRQSARLSALFVCGFLLVLIVFVTFGQMTGQLTGFWQQAVTFNIQVYGAEEAPQSLSGTVLILLRSLIVIAVLGGMGFFVMSLKSDLRTEFILFGLLFCTIALSYVYQNKGFGYHLGGIILLFAFGTAFFIGVTGQWMQADERKSVLGLGIVAICLLLVFVALGKKIVTSDPLSVEFGLTRLEQKEILDIIAAQKDSDSTLIIWGRHYHVGMLADLPSAWPFINAPLRGGAHLVPEWQEMAARRLQNECPRFVMVTNAELSDDVHTTSTLQALLRRQLQEGYQPAFQTDLVTLFMNKAC